MIQMVNSVSWSGKHFTIKRVDDNMKGHSITTTVRVIDVMEIAKLFSRDCKLLETYIAKRRVSRIIAKVAVILLKKMYSKDMMILDFKLMDLTNVKFDKDFEWSLTIKNNNIETVLEYYIARCAHSRFFTRCFIRKYNKIKR